MKLKHLMLCAAVCSLPLCASAQYGNQTKANQQIKMAQSWSSGKLYHTSASLSDDGAIQFVYGAEVPLIKCAILQVCDIALQSGEVVNNINIGDQVRWNITGAVVGDGNNRRTHLIVKPYDSGLSTTLFVSTNKRAYHFQLQSNKKDYMPYVSFIYPEDQQKQWQQLQKQENQAQARSVLEDGTPAQDLNFDYTIEGSASWKPVRAYDDGKQTFIQLPKTSLSSDVPVLLLLQEEGGWFSDDQTGIVNYRVQNNKYIVDGVFKQFILISGVGSSQTKVTITRKGD